MANYQEDNYYIMQPSDGEKLVTENMLRGKRGKVLLTCPPKTDSGITLRA
jgi:hypothetical protein